MTLCGLAVIPAVELGLGWEFVWPVDKQMFRDRASAAVFLMPEICWEECLKWK